MEKFILLWMLFMHIVDDYYLQGWLAKGKQKSWWESQPNFNPKYRYDYIAALLMHAFSWTFSIMLPLAIYNKLYISNLYMLVFVCNLVIHAIADDLKANKLKTNLVQDQAIHIAQVIITYMIMV